MSDAPAKVRTIRDVYRELEPTVSARDEGNDTVVDFLLGGQVVHTWVLSKRLFDGDTHPYAVVKLGLEVASAAINHIGDIPVAAEADDERH